MLAPHDVFSCRCQSTVQNGARGQEHKQRPAHKPSKRLLSHELQNLYSILEPDHVTLATAVAEILHDYNGEWRKKACGIFCFIKDYEKRNYYFRLYDLKAKQLIYEETVPATLRLEKSLDVLYTFNGSNCKIGINFVDSDEAQTFSHHFHSKQEDRQNKREKKEKNAPSKTPRSTSADASTANRMKRPLFTFPGQKKKNSQKHTIVTEPLTFEHSIHISKNNSFCVDETQKEMCERMVTCLNISEDLISYERSFVNTDGRHQKILTESISSMRNKNDQGSEQQMSTDQPPIPARSRQILSKSNGSCVPYKDVSPPSYVNNPLNNNRRLPLPVLFSHSIDFNQQTASTIPQRPDGHRTDSGYQPTEPSSAFPRSPPPIPSKSRLFETKSPADSSRVDAPSVPPPTYLKSRRYRTKSVTDSRQAHARSEPLSPIMNNSATQSQSFGSPPPPAPLPPSASISSSTSFHQPNDLLQAIRIFDATKLKSHNQEALRRRFPSTGDTSSGAQDTMPMNIRKILADRREKLIGREDRDESEPSDEDWS